MANPTTSVVLRGLAAVALLTWGSSAGAQSDECVWIEIASAEDGRDELVLTYPAPVAPTRVTSDFRELAMTGGWRSAPPTRSATDDRTFACLCEGILDRSSGRLPWEVFGFVLRRHERVHLTVFADAPFYYKGKTGAYENPRVRVTFASAPERSVYGAMIELTGEEPATPAELVSGLVPVSEGDGTEGANGTRRVIGWVVLGVGGGLFVVLCTAIIVVAVRRRRAQQ